MRRLPGPAVCRLSKGDHTPEAPLGLFRDWQRTQTQSSARALRSLRQQMDVRFCESRNHQPRGVLACGNPESLKMRALPSAPRKSALFY
jgi:hypothetical protein